MSDQQATVRVIARITGRVQGVKYRATAQREARRRGLTGWVRNEPDGAVMTDVEGDPAAVTLVSPPLPSVSKSLARPASISRVPLRLGRRRIAFHDSWFLSRQVW